MPTAPVLNKSVADLLISIKRRGQQPSDGGATLSDEDILALASDEIENVVAPRLHANRGWYQATEDVFTLSSTRSYRIPTRAVGASIVSVEVDNGGNGDYRFLNLHHPLQMKSTYVARGEGYYIYGNNVVLSDGCPTSGNLRIKYLLRISRLYLLNNVISAVGATTITLVNSAALSIVTYSGGVGKVDIYRADSPYEIFARDVTVTATSGVTLTMTPPSGTAVGMKVGDIGWTYHPQLPNELHDYLAQRTLLRIAEALGHKEDAAAYEKKLSDMETAFDRQTSPRARGDAKAIVDDSRLIDWRF